MPRLPKTRSGKILRGTMKKITDRDPWVAPATIEDPKALDEIEKALAARTRQPPRATSERPASAAPAGALYVAGPS